MDEAGHSDEDVGCEEAREVWAPMGQRLPELEGERGVELKS